MTLNQQNLRVARSNNRSKLLGAHWNERQRRFTSQIWVCGKGIHLGWFNTAEAAHEAYLKAKRLLHAGNTL